MPVGTSLVHALPPPPIGLQISPQKRGGSFRDRALLLGFFVMGAILVLQLVLQSRRHLPLTDTYDRETSKKEAEAPKKAVPAAVPTKADPRNTSNPLAIPTSPVVTPPRFPLISGQSVKTGEYDGFWLTVSKKHNLAVTIIPKVCKQVKEIDVMGVRASS
jgi:hypothetical protein